MDVAGGEVLACQIVNSQPAVAQFSAKRTTTSQKGWWAPKTPHHGCAQWWPTTIP